jgi:FkbM family methyltransferase
MIKIIYQIKKYSPETYSVLRKVLFPLVGHLRARKGSTFVKPITKSVSILGYNYSVFLDPTNGFIDTQIFTTGQYELDILSVIKENLKPGETFVDIGGNIGWHTLFAAHVVGESGHVHTFEPIKKLVQQINKNISLNNLDKCITVHPFGCSSTESEVTININLVNIGGSSIFKLATQSEKNETISLKPADSVLSTLIPKVKLIKIDTEGSELEVLKGLRNTLENHRPKLIIEYSPSFWGAGSLEKSLAFFQILNDYFYQIFDLESGHKRIEPDEMWIRNFKKLQTNFLCIPK